MLKRTIEVSGWGYHLAGQGKHLKLSKNEATVGSVPFEDLGVLVLDTAGATITTSALVQTADQGGITVLCGRDHLPVAMIQPLRSHSLSTERLIAQIDLSRPMRSALWAQIVRSKIRGQAKALGAGHASEQRLLRLADQVQPADRGHGEAQAARVYWRQIFAEYIDDFRRDRNKPGPNALLNYGYAVMRASMARALCAAGLQPALGLQHHNRGNHFCLADDFLEPFRPLVDLSVRALLRQGKFELNPDSKRQLLETLTASITVCGEISPASVAMQKLAYSYAEILAQESSRDEQPGTKRRPNAMARAKLLRLPWLD